MCLNCVTETIEEVEVCMMAYCFFVLNVEVEQTAVLVMTSFFPLQFSPSSLIGAMYHQGVDAWCGLQARSQMAADYQEDLTVRCMMGKVQECKGKEVKVN